MRRSTSAGQVERSPPKTSGPSGSGPSAGLPDACVASKGRVRCHAIHITQEASSKHTGSIKMRRKEFGARIWFNVCVGRG
jgi:hypothetical protein